MIFDGRVVPWTSKQVVRSSFRNKFPKQRFNGASIVGVVSVWSQRPWFGGVFETTQKTVPFKHRNGCQLLMGQDALGGYVFSICSWWRLVAFNRGIKSGLFPETAVVHLIRALPGVNIFRDVVSSRSSQRFQKPSRLQNVRVPEPQITRKLFQFPLFVPSKTKRKVFFVFANSFCFECYMEPLSLYLHSFTICWGQYSPGPNLLLFCPMFPDGSKDGWYPIPANLFVPIPKGLALCFAILKCGCEK